MGRAPGHDPGRTVSRGQRPGPGRAGPESGRAGSGRAGPGGSALPVPVDVEVGVDVGPGLVAPAGPAERQRLSVCGESPAAMRCECCAMGRMAMRSGKRRSGPASSMGRGGACVRVRWTAPERGLGIFNQNDSTLEASFIPHKRRCVCVRVRRRVPERAAAVEGMGADEPEKRGVCVWGGVCPRGQP